MNREDVYVEYLMVKESSLLGYVGGKSGVSKGIRDFESKTGTKLTDDEKKLIRSRAKGGMSGFLEGSILGGVGTAIGGAAGSAGVGSGLEKKIADSLAEAKYNRILKRKGHALSSDKIKFQKQFSKNLKGLPALAIGGLLGTGLAGYGTYKRKQREAAREARNIVKNRR